MRVLRRKGCVQTYWWGVSGLIRCNHKDEVCALLVMLKVFQGKGSMLLHDLCCDGLQGGVEIAGKNKSPHFLGGAVGRWRALGSLRKELEGRRPQIQIKWVRMHLKVERVQKCP